jgi:glycosyltransferase involved in cell wall biosynthesis
MGSISIALATYNGSKFILEQLQSLARQTHLPDELVVSDDCSTDGTVEMIENFAKHAPFKIRIVKNKTNRGYRDNFMQTAALCSSPLVAFCDQDDVWHPDKISEILKCFDDPSVMLVHHNANIVDANGRCLRLALNRQMLKEKLAPRYFAMGFTEVFRRELLNFTDLWDLSLDHQEPTEKMAHDKWVFFLAASLGKIVFLDKPLVDYRQHEKNTYGLKKEGLWTRTLKKIRYSVKSWPNVALFAERSAEILSRMSHHYSDSAAKRDRLSHRSERFIQLREWYEDRVLAYNRAGFVGRAIAWGRLVRSGAYKPYDPWSFGWTNLIADATVGVLLAPLFLTFSSTPSTRQAHEAVDSSN